MNGILAYVGIGSNMGDSLNQCKEAVTKMSHIEGVRVERTSSYYKSEPVADTDEQKRVLEDQSWFINAVAELRTILPPRDFLKALQKIEQAMGRTREFKGGPRTIDLDLLLFDQEMIEEDDLIVPHPRMHKRRFVLVPMCEIASYVIHPTYGISMRGLMDRLADEKKVERLT